MEKPDTKAIVTLKKGEGRFLKAGGAWIYDNEIASVVPAEDRPAADLDTASGEKQRTSAALAAGSGETCGKGSASAGFREFSGKGSAAAGSGKAFEKGSAEADSREMSGKGSAAADIAAVPNGSLVSVRDFDGYPMGTGFINRHSKIRVRMLTRNPNQPITREFFRDRVRAAWTYRKTVLAPEDLCACRLIFGEADFLPGLTVDRFADVCVVQCLALGMEPFKQLILEELQDVLARDGIAIRAFYERSDAREREKEGMQRVKGWIPLPGEDAYPAEAVSASAGLNRCRAEKGQQAAAGGGARPAEEQGKMAGDAAPDGLQAKTAGDAAPAGKQEKIGENAVPAADTLVQITENGVRYIVDIENGQKTGFFLDQKYNRRAVGKLCKDADVLDCFTHTGSFALNAAHCGARRVLGVDASDTAIRQARENAAQNGLEDRVTFVCADAFDLLREKAEKGETFDVVILDPPAFTKSRNSVKNAAKGYREINRQGMKLVRDGGYLATCSCSSFMTCDLFTQVIRQAAASAHKRLRQVEYRTQAPDHPILWAADESYYLKFYIFQVCEER